MKGPGDKLGQRMISFLCVPFCEGHMGLLKDGTSHVLKCLHFRSFEHLKTMILLAILVLLSIQEGNSRIQTRVVGYKVPNRDPDSQSSEERSTGEKSNLKKEGYRVISPALDNQSAGTKPAPFKQLSRLSSYQPDKPFVVSDISFLVSLGM